MKAIAVMVLAFNFIKSAFLSAWETGRIILLEPEQVRSGMTIMPFDDLTPAQASLVGALITLAPGTTTVDIDLDAREFRLHLLDLDSRESTLRAIEHDFILPMKRYNGAVR